MEGNRFCMLDNFRLMEDQIIETIVYISSCCIERKNFI